MRAGWLRILFAGPGLLLLCVAVATGIGYVVNHWILGRDLWLVIDLVLGAVFGVPLFAVLFAWLLRRWRHPKIPVGQRRRLG